MTQIAFQSALAELVAGTGNAAQWEPQLSGEERGLLAEVSGQAGVKVMRTLYFGWRLTKVLSLLSLTTRTLGDEAAAHHLRRFWGKSKARSFYFVDECLAFLAFLEASLDEIPLVLRDVMAFERARLELRLETIRRVGPSSRRVLLHHVPAELIAGTGEPARLPGPIILLGSLTDDGAETWTLLKGG